MVDEVVVDANISTRIQADKECIDACKRLEKVLNGFSFCYHEERRRAAKAHKQTINSLKKLVSTLEEGVKLNENNVNGEEFTTIESTLSHSCEVVEESLKNHCKQKNGLSKVGHVINKEYKKDFDLIVNSCCNSGNYYNLNPLIYYHFLFYGDFDIAETFKQESGLSWQEISTAKNIDVISVIDELKSILNNVENEDFNLAIKFLDRECNSIRFDIERRLLIKSLIDGNILYVTNRLRELTSKYPTQSYDETRKITSLIPLTKESIKNSPYTNICTNEGLSMLKFRIATEFLTKYLNKPYDVIHECILLSMQTINQIYSGGKSCFVTSSNKPVIPYLQRSELVFPIDIVGDRFYHHNIFICPIQKGQIAPNNPPAVLSCGHMVSLSNLEFVKLFHKEKCPLCNHERCLSRVAVFCDTHTWKYYFKRQ